MYWEVCMCEGIAPAELNFITRDEVRVVMESKRNE